MSVLAFTTILFKNLICSIVLSNGLALQLKWILPMLAVVLSFIVLTEFVTPLESAENVKKPLKHEISQEKRLPAHGYVVEDSVTSKVGTRQRGIRANPVRGNVDIGKILSLIKMS